MALQIKTDSWNPTFGTISVEDPAFPRGKVANSQSGNTNLLPTIFDNGMKMVEIGP